MQPIAILNFAYDILKTLVFSPFGATVVVVVVVVDVVVVVVVVVVPLKENYSMKGTNITNSYCEITKRNIKYLFLWQ